jgi:hypothetical protein
MVLLGTVLLLPSIAFSSRNISSLPATESFDSNNYQDIVTLGYHENPATNGATHEWIQNGGWSGGAAKFQPPTSSDGHAGLGQFVGINNGRGTRQLNVRFLIYHGSEWNRIQPRNKLVIMNREDGIGRPMIGEVNQDNYRTYTPCDNTLCIFENGTYWPDGTESHKIGRGPGQRLEEWISVELEANVITGVVRLYIDTQDGELSGLYLEKRFEDSPSGEGTPLLKYIDTIGGWFNGGTARHPNTYYKIDELVIDDSYIGPPDGFVDGPNPPPINLTENSYVSLNPSLTAASVMSLSDNNVITAGDRTLNLDLYERGTLVSSNGSAITPGMVISGTGPFDLGSIKSATDTPVHASMLGTVFAMPHSRNSHIYHMMSPQGDASVRINVEGTVHRRTLPAGEVVNFDAGAINGNLGAVITSDRPILVSHTASASYGYTDASPMPPADTELWGVCSTGAYVSAVENNTHLRIYTSNSSTTRTMTLNAGQKGSVCGSLPSNSVRQGRGPAVHIVADKPVSAVQIADGDGIEQTAFYPTSLLNSRFGIPKDSQYLAITCPSANTRITLFRPNDDPVTRNCSANGDRPGKAYFGSQNNGTHIAQGSYLESTKPIHVIYEVVGSEDEHNLIGSGSYTTAIFSTDMEGSSPVADWMDARTTQAGGGATITFPRAGNNRVAQFNYRAGHSNEVWLRHNFGSFPYVNEEPVEELWLNFEYQISDTSIYNQNTGQASKIVYVNWTRPYDPTSQTQNPIRTSQVVLGAINNGNGHRFRLSREVFNENGSWAPGGEWLTDFSPEVIPERVCAL